MRREEQARAARRARWRRLPVAWRIEGQAAGLGPGPARRGSVWFWLIGILIPYGLGVSTLSQASVRPKPPPTPITVRLRPPPPPPALATPALQAEAPARAPTRPRRRPVASAPIPASEPAPAPRRVVGLSLSATVKGGSGPAFAVGETRAGVTEPRASAPTVAAPAPSAPRRKGSSGSGPEPTRARRLRAIEPPYPAGYREQGLEGEVTVALTIGVDGAVRTVTVVAPSPHEGFNRSAIETAWRERFQPATEGGVPVERTVHFRYRFQLTS